MEGKLLVSPAGFQGWKVSNVVRILKPTRLVLLHTDHPKAVRNVERLRGQASKGKVLVETKLIHTAFDFVEWFQSFSRVISEAPEEEVLINLTPGHGVAISMAAMVGARRNLACVCYDKEGTGLHHVSPSIIFHLDALEKTDRQLLRALGPLTMKVTDLAEKAAIPELSTASVALKRLHQRGFLLRTQRGREVEYRLRPGVSEFLRSVVGTAETKP